MTWNWHSAIRSNQELVAKLCQKRIIINSRVKNAMEKVDRFNFSPRNPYHNKSQSIGFDSTISAPHVHANVAEVLLPFLKPGARVLDIGSGSGYLTALFAELVEIPERNLAHGNHEIISTPGRVVGIECIVQLRDMGERNLQKTNRGRELISSGKVCFVHADGRRGWLDDSPAQVVGWDAIYVGAAASELHGELVEQLGRPGRLYIPLEDPNGQGQWMWQIDKDIYGIVRKERKGKACLEPLVVPSSS